MIQLRDLRDVDRIIYQTIKEHNEKIPPTDAEIAQHLHISRGTIRESFKRLTKMGLVEPINKKPGSKSFYYIVYAPDGHKVAQTLPKNAKTPSDAYPEHLSLEYTDRKCMCCSKIFKSEGIHNRLCNDCKQTASDSHWLEGSSYSAVSSPRYGAKKPRAAREE